MKTQKHFSILVFALGIFILSCSKHDDDVKQPSVQPANGFFILNQGSFGHNDASVTYYDFTKNQTSSDLFKTANSLALGDVAQDFIIYGSKMYITVNNSQIVFIADANTLKIEDSIKINLPRYVIPYNDKVFISSWDNNIYEIDTADFFIKNKIKISGRDPEGMAIVGNNLYVANSGAKSGDILDSTLSVIDLNSLKEVNKINIGYMPGKIAVGTNNKLYVICSGQTYVSPKYVSSISVVNTEQASLEKDINISTSGLDIYNNTAYVINETYNTNGSTTISSPIINLSTNKILQQNFISDGTQLESPYNIQIDQQNGDVYICDAFTFTQNGYVYCFSSDGKLKSKISSNGIGPCKIIFVRKN